MITKQYLLELITEERDKYNTYLTICANYYVKPDPIISAKCMTKIETLESLLKLI